MTALSEKRVLIVGDEDEITEQVKEQLTSLDIHYQVVSCTDASADLLSEENIDLVLINHLHEESVCYEVLQAFKDQEVKPVPIFVLVPENDEKIEQVLAAGATDYLTPMKPAESVTQKMRSIFGYSDLASGNTVIDITPNQVQVNGEGVRVYIVEDDPLLRNLLSIRLDKSSFPYEFSNDGNNATVAMKQFKPNIIILDLMLPGRSGFDVLEEIKADPELAQVPVVVFSNRDGQEDRHRASELGAAAFYVKAMTDLSDLIEHIESLSS